MPDHSATDRAHSRRRVRRLASNPTPGGVQIDAKADGSRRRTGLGSTLVIGVVVALVAVSCSSSGSSSSAGSSPATTGSAQTASSKVSGPTSTASSPDGKVILTTLSAPAPYVSGGQVMLGVRRRSGALGDPTTVTLTVNGKPATQTVQGAHATSTELQQVVTGLHPGANTVSATVSGSTATMTVTDHSINGPVFSGPRQTPFACTTQAAGLGASSPPDCSVPTKDTLEYVSTDGSVKPMVAGGHPTDMALMAGSADQVVPAIILDEKGVIDRSIYEIAIPESTATLGADGTVGGLHGGGWNKRLVYRYGGGCGTTYSQGSDFAGALDPKLLSLGYAVTTSTLNTFQSACNATLSAEVTMMVKQHFIDSFGDPMFTIGDGGSGGSIQQLQIAQNYPGLLDGLSPELPFPDAISISAGVSDCTLLNHYYQAGGAVAHPGPAHRRQRSRHRPDL